MSYRIGISGWRYTPWRSLFYPPNLPQRSELAFASRMVNSIEINGSFYRLQRPEYYTAWHKETPKDFIFSVKGPRFITHMKRLIEVEDALANFFASGVLNLEEKLGPILWQFPENFAFDESRFKAFFKQLPKTRAAAIKLARKSKRFNKIQKYHSTGNVELRHAVEIRSQSFENKTFINLLEKTR